MNSKINLNKFLKIDLDIVEVWKKITPYLQVERLLEIGVGLDDCPQKILENAKQIERITIDKDLFNKSKKKFSHPNVNYKLMGAEGLEYSDEYFDCIFSSSAYHEFNSKIQNQALSEMYRTLKKGGVMIFIEPRESAITNELFKVFDKHENHAQRIKNSFELLDRFIKTNKMSVLLEGRTEIIDTFGSITERDEKLLEWWSDIKIPKDNAEKDKMIKKINQILKNVNIDKSLKIIEDSQYLVIKK